jgi:tRNA/tmRNA/rRNA uracil-C5-methylase (TrmA/RlmC/RlmD family)
MVETWYKSQLKKMASSLAKHLGYQLIPAAEPPTVIPEHESHYIYRNKERFEVKEGYPKYFILQNERGVKAILCNQCLMISFSLNDIHNRYCHNCNTSHIPGNYEKNRKYLSMEEVMTYEALSMSGFKAGLLRLFPFRYYKMIDRKYKRYLFHPMRIRREKK